MQETIRNRLAELYAENRPLFLIGGAILIIFFILLIIGTRVWSERFMASYLTAYLYWVEISLGCLGILLATNLIKSRWGVAVQRIAAAGALTIPLMALLFIPIFFNLGGLYAWTEADYPIRAHQPAFRYLSAPFYTVRTILFFGVWTWLATRLTSSLYAFDNSEMDRSTVNDNVDKRWNNTQKLFAYGALIFVVTVSFAAFDWSMSLDPYWFSSIYGWLAVGRQAMMAIALIIFVLYMMSRTRDISHWVTPQTVSDLGMLQAGTILAWAYMHFFQFLISWEANLPKEARWFGPRITEGWESIALIIVAFHLAIPFILLIIPSPKNTLPLLAGISVLLLSTHWLEQYWLVMPSAVSTPNVFVVDIAIWVIMGVIWIGAFSWLLARKETFPRRHPFYPEDAVIEPHQSTTGLATS